MVCSRGALFLLRNPPLGTHRPRINCFATVNESNLLNGIINWRQLSQHPEGSPNHWKDDIRAGADPGTPRISPDHRIHIDSIQTTVNYDDLMTKMRGEDIGMERAKERTMDAANTVLGLAKEGAAKAIESGLELGELAKRTMDVEWDAVKDTANNIKDAITGDDQRRHHQGRRDLGHGSTAYESSSDARFNNRAAGDYHVKH